MKRTIHSPCEVSRTTISNYLKALEATFVAHVVRPFSTHRPTEIVSAPKVYGFDTGFVATVAGRNCAGRILAFFENTSC